MSDNPSSQLSNSNSSSPSSGGGLLDVLSVISNPIMGLINTGLNFLGSSIHKDDSLKQWQRENEYNTPKNQLSRLREAGLNPALMYQNGASGLLSAHSPELGQASPSAMQGIDPVSAAQIRNIDADTQTKQAQARNLDEQTKETQYINWFNDFEKQIKESNAEQIKDAARIAAYAGQVQSEHQYFAALYAAATLASILRPDSHDVKMNGMYSLPFSNAPYDSKLGDLLSKNGFGEHEQRSLERALYKSYYEAQKQVNETTRLESNLDSILPSLISKAPDWLQPILVILKGWLVDGKVPSFSISPRSSNYTISNNSENNFDYMINNRNHR